MPKANIGRFTDLFQYHQIKNGIALRFQFTKLRPVFVCSSRLARHFPCCACVRLSRLILIAAQTGHAEVLSMGKQR